MTANTEPLKVGEECREAFEQWMQETYGYVPEPNTVYREGTYLSKRDDDRWIAYQAGRIQSTEPSPAEVSRDNCQICNGRRGGVLGNENVIAGVVICDYCHSDQMKFQALSQQSPARVEGELTDEEIAQARRQVMGTPEHRKFGYDIAFARAIERALSTSKQEGK